MRIVRLLGLLACLPVSAFGQIPSDPDEHLKQTIIALEQRWAQAELRRDTTAMSALLSQDFRATTFYGLLVTDRQWALRAVLDPALRLDSIVQEELNVRLYGEVAVVTGRAVMQWGYGDEDLSGAYRYTRVYLKEGEVWKMTTVHVSREAAM